VFSNSNKVSLGIMDTATWDAKSSSVVVWVWSENEILGVWKAENLMVSLGTIFDV